VKNSRLKWHKNFKNQYLGLVSTAFYNLTIDEIKSRFWKNSCVSRKLVSGILRQLENEKIVSKSTFSQSKKVGRPECRWSRNPDTLLKLGDYVNWIHPLGTVSKSRAVKIGICMEIGPYAIISVDKTIRVRVPISSIRLSCDKGKTK